MKNYNVKKILECVFLGIVCAFGFMCVGAFIVAGIEYGFWAEVIFGIIMGLLIAIGSGASFLLDAFPYIHNTEIEEEFIEEELTEAEQAFFEE